MNPRFRPRLRFSLRTLFVLVTIAASVMGYAGWQWRIVQERKAVRAWIMNYTGEIIEDKRIKVDVRVLPWTRKLLGDPPSDYFLVNLPVSVSAQERVFSAFPEAVICTYQDFWNRGQRLVLTPPDKDQTRPYIRPKAESTQ